MAGRPRTRSAGVRRRRPYKGDLREEALLGTLERLLAQKPLERIEVGELARGAGISRPTFYFYFESKEAALARLAALVREEMYEAADAEPEEGLDPLEDIRMRIETTARLWREWGHVLRAAAQTWATEPDSRALYEEGIGRFIEGLRRKIIRMRRRGLAPEGPPEAEELARALVWMNERCFYASTLGSRVAPSEEELVDTLSVIWYRAIYCGHPASSSGPPCEA